MAQNLIVSPRLSRMLVRAADVRPGERVYDLGAGAGAITAELVRAGAQVIAVERDATLAAKLRARFAGSTVRVAEADLRDVAFQPLFKLVANPPFNLTAELLRRVLTREPSADAAALVLQWEAARKWAGAPRPTAASLAAWPWFEVALGPRLAATDFVPRPSVKTVLLVVRRRATPRLAPELRPAWDAFVRGVFARGRPGARAALRPLLSSLQWRRLAADRGVGEQAQLAELAPDDWAAAFALIARAGPERSRRRLGLEPHLCERLAQLLLAASE